MINWSRINDRLPYAKIQEQFEKRKQMWRAIDVNDNGFVSLAEITRVEYNCRIKQYHLEEILKGVRDVIQVDALFECRPAINAAFHHCKSVSKVEDDMIKEGKIKYICRERFLGKMTFLNFVNLGFF